AIPVGTTSGQLCRTRSHSSQFGRKDLAWKGATQCQSLPEVGLHRSGQLHRCPSEQAEGTPRGEFVSTAQSREKTYGPLLQRVSMIRSSNLNSRMPIKRSSA